MKLGLNLEREKLVPFKKNETKLNKNNIRWASN